MAAWFFSVWTRSWSGLVSTTSASGAAASSAAALSISSELVHAPSASTEAAARAVTSGVRRVRTDTVGVSFWGQV
jgi:hypothetical protein